MSPFEICIFCDLRFIWSLRFWLFEFPLLRSGGRRAFLVRWSPRVTEGGAQGSENAGMSNRNLGEIPRRRKSKVSRAMVIIPGWVGPKARPKGVVDGQPVNIPAPMCYSMEWRIAVLFAHYRICVEVLRMCGRQIRRTQVQWNRSTLLLARDKKKERGTGKNFSGS